MHAISNSVIRTEWDEACREFRELGSEHEEPERFLDPCLSHSCYSLGGVKQSRLAGRVV